MRSFAKVVVAWVLAFLCQTILVCPSAIAAGFDCGKATTPTEKMICADPQLLSLDSRLLVAYRAASITLDPSRKHELVREQRRWIAYVRDICERAWCVRDAYIARIDLLNNTKGTLANEAACSIPQGSSCRSVVFYRDTSDRMGSFNKSLALSDRGTTVIGCDRLIDLPVGFANSNHSFGGYCTTKKGGLKKRIAICNDDMMGHFAMRSIEAKDETLENLVEFTNEHCFGG